MRAEERVMRAARGMALAMFCALAVGCGDEGATDSGELCREVVCDANEVCAPSSGSCECAGGFALQEGACVEDRCSGVSCGSGATCSPSTGTCECAAGWIEVGDGCEEAAGCATDADCDDQDACNGVERCNQGTGTCEAGAPLECAAGEVCDPALQGGACTCAPGFVDVGGGCEAIACVIDADCDDGLACNGVERCDPEANACVDGAALECGANESCAEEERGICVCDAGFVDAGSGCEEIVCTLDEDCDDGLVCNGAEFCDLETNRCGFGTPLACEAGARCSEEAARCMELCDVPLAPTFDVISKAETLRFDAGGLDMEIAALPADSPLSSAFFTAGSELALGDLDGPTRILARISDASCVADDVFDSIYEVAATYAPAAGIAGSNAIAKDSPRIVGWATGVADTFFGAGVSESWQVPTNAIGGGGLLPLGHGGWISLTFDPPIADGPGSDFAVFENGFSDSFLEVAFIEVSSDGERWIRFDSGYLGTVPVGSFGMLDTTLIGGLAGKFRVGFGTPFDLALLKNHPAVRSGAVDLQAITHVRVVDVVGDGSTLDSFGRPIYHPYPSTGSAGFDITGIGVLNAALD